MYEVMKHPVSTESFSPWLLLCFYTWEVRRELGHWKYSTWGASGRYKHLLQRPPSRRCITGFRTVQVSVLLSICFYHAMLQWFVSYCYAAPIYLGQQPIVIFNILRILLVKFIFFQTSVTTDFKTWVSFTEMFQCA